MIEGSANGIAFVDLLKIIVPAMLVFGGWLWRQINSNHVKSNQNAADIALINQTLQSQGGRVDGMEEEIKKLSGEITKVKFSIQSLDHKQDKHHLELLNEIRNIYKQK